MSPPSHVFLPLSGAVVLAAAVIGAWLWPVPPPPQVHFEPLPLATPVFTPPPAPAPPPRPARPVVRAAPPAPRVEPPRPVAPMEPPRTVPEPSYPPPQVTAPPQEPKLPPGAFSMRGRAAALLESNVVQMEQARDQARARGDEAEWQRLDATIRQNRERLEHVRAKAGPPEPPQM